MNGVWRIDKTRQRECIFIRRQCDLYVCFIFDCWIGCWHCDLCRGSVATVVVSLLSAQSPRRLVAGAIQSNRTRRQRVLLSKPLSSVIREFLCLSFPPQLCYYCISFCRLSVLSSSSLHVNQRCRQDYNVLCSPSFGPVWAFPFHLVKQSMTSIPVTGPI